MICVTMERNSQVDQRILRYVDIDRYSGRGMAVRYGPFLWRFKKRETQEQTRSGACCLPEDCLRLPLHIHSALPMSLALLSWIDNIGMVIVKYREYACLLWVISSSFRHPTPNCRLLSLTSISTGIDETKAELPLIPNYEVEASDAVDKLYQVIKAEETRCTDYMAFCRF